MAQNVWKKQAEANKASQPPKPPGGGNPPPWMKNKVQQNQAVQQVPDTPQVNATQPTPPLTQPVAQQGPPGTQKPASTPAWMKNKQQGGQPPTATNLPPFAKPPGTGTAPTTAGTAPAWMKNKPSQSPMSTDRKMQDQKAKQEQEQKKRKQQQVRKQEQLKREQKQRKMMQAEEQISKIREQEDKKKPQKKKSPTKKSSQQKSPMKNLKRVKNGTPFHNYLLTLGPCLSKHTWYQDKINLQQQFIKNINVLAENLKRSLSAYLVQYKPVLRKKNIINLQNVVAEYALVEGVSGDNGSMYFKHKMVQALQIKFMCYQALFYCISKLIKKNGEFRVRVPLLNWLEVKGMYFLCQGVCEQLLDAVASPADNYVDIHGQLTQLEKQLKDSGYENIDRKLFSVKKVIVADQQFYIIYLSQNFDYSIHAPNPSSLTCQTFQPFIPTTLPALTNLSLLSTGTQSFPFSLMKPSAINPIVSHTAPKLKQAFLNLFQVAHALRVVYASCQGELQQLSFWKLVFDGNRDIWTMAAAVGDVYGMTNIPQFKLIKEGKEVKVRNRMMLAKILETMLPIKFGVGRQVPSQMFGSPKRANKEEQGRKIPQHIESFIKVRAYPINCFELYEVSHLFPKTISNPSKNKLSQQSLALQSEIINSSSQIYFNRLDYLMNKSLLLFQKGLLTENGDTIFQALKILEEYHISRGSEIQKVGLWMALIRLYMEAAQAGLYPSSPQPHNTPMSEQKQKQNQTNSLSNRFDKSKLEQSEVRQIENSLELKRQKDRKYTQEEVYHKQSQMKRKSPSTNKIQQVDTDYQNSMLHFFSKLLAFIQELFEDQGQTWLHAELYMVLASYYSKRGLESSNVKKNNKNTRNNQKQQQRDEPIRIQQQAKLSYFNRKTGVEKQKVYSKSHVLERKDGRQQHEKSQKQSDVQSLAESQLQLSPKTPSNSHPYCKQCTKLLQLSYPIFLQYFGNQSEQLAEFLINQSQIYYNVNDLPKCEASITEALKIYKNKSLSKNGKNIIICNTILGKTLIKRGKAEANGEIIAKGIGLLEGIVDDMGGIGLAGDAQVMAVYQFLCQNVSANLSKAHVKSKSRGQFDMEGAKQTKMQLYMQKMAQMSISSGNIHTIKQVISKIVKSELQFYSKQRAVVLKQLHERFMKQNLSDKREQSEQNEQQMLQMNLQGIKYLEENKQNYGGLIEMIKWSFGILRSKSESVEVNKATQIMENVLGFFREKQILGLLCL